MTQLDTKLFNEKGEEPFKKLDSAAKINIELGFVLQNNEIEVNVGFSTPIKTILCSKNPSCCALNQAG